MTLRIGIFGAGAIGGYLGGRLAAAGADVTLVGRPSLVSAASRLVATDLTGREHRPQAIDASTDPRVLRGVDVCLVTVKSDDTAAAGTALAGILPPDSVVVSLQNGLRNAPLLAQRLPGRAVAAGMVTYNVIREGPARFRQATSGPLLAEKLEGPAGARLEALAAAFARAQAPLGLRPDMDRVLLGKLLLNLNNGLCAATGVSIAESLRSRDLRWCFAACLHEGLAVARRAGLRPASLGRLSPRLIARALPLPDAVLFRLAPALISIDPAARSSTLQDLERGRRTEIAHLNGEIVALAAGCGASAPANAYVVQEVRRLEASERPLAFLTPAQLRAGMQQALRAK